MNSHDRLAGWHAHHCPERWSMARRLDFGALTRACAPSLDDTALAQLAIFVAWFFWYDDTVDRDLVGMPQSIVALNNAIAAVWRTGVVDETPIVVAFATIWRDLAPHLNDWQRARLCDDLSEYLMATAWEHQVRGTHVAIADYILRRPLTAGMFAFLDLIEAYAGMAPWDDASLAMVRHYSARRACWTNDRHSAAKEAAAGDILNLALLLQRDNRVTLVEAMHDLDGIDAADAAIIDVAGRRVPPSLHPIMDLYAAVLRGNEAWTGAAVRYTVATLMVEVHA